MRPKKSAAQRARERTAKAAAAARQLRGQAVIVHAEGVLDRAAVWVDAAVLLGTALTGAPCKYLGFDVPATVPAARQRRAGDVVRVKVKRSLLREARVALKRHLRGRTVTAWIDDYGVHLRWHDGNGGLNLRDAAQRCGGTDYQRALADCFAVDLRPAAREKAA